MEDAQFEEPEAYSSLDSQEVEQLIDQRLETAAKERAVQRRKMEYIKFGVLAAILLGTVFVLAVAQPLVFGRIVPAVMGEGQTGDAPLAVDETMPETMSEDTVEPGQPTAVPVVNPEESEQGGGAPEAVEPQPESNETVEQPTAVTGQIYVVQPGDTLNSIARQFNTSVEAITAANNIQNPDSLLVGTTLTIPQP